jgi:hypothetical protein
MYRFALAVLVPILLSACAGGPYGGFDGGRDRDRDRDRGERRDRPPVTLGTGAPTTTNPLARSAAYTCEDQTTVLLTEGQPTAQVTLNSGVVLNLNQRADPLALRYGAPPFEFRASGGEGSLLNNGRAVRCRAK